MKPTIIILQLAALLTSPVYSQTRNYTDHGKIRVLASQATLHIEPTEERLSTERQAAGLLAAAGAILPPAVNLAADLIVQQVKQNALAYQATWSCSASGDRFYPNNDLAALPKLTLTRTIKPRKGENITAVEIVLTPEFSDDKTAFRYSVRDPIRYRWSVAKTRGCHSWINVTLALTFRSIYINKETYKVSELRTTSLTLPMVQVGVTRELQEPACSGWIPLPPRSTARVSSEPDGTKAVYERLSDNTGTYEVDITVTETNALKISMERKSETIKGTSESATDLIHAIIETITEETK